MRVNDAVIGSVLLLLSIAVLWHVRTFPTMPGQSYGPALFPGLIASGLAGVSLLLIVQGLRSGEPWLRWAGGSARGRIAFATTVAAMFFYWLLADRLGFIVCAAVALIAMLLSFGVRASRALPVALVATLVIHGAFYKLLKVPLPWGILQPLAW
jgi:putative tricarboxylic transport membrane protein